MSELTALIRPVLTRPVPVLIGVTGNVAVGKSTFARDLAQEIHGLAPGKIVSIVSTDSFLFANAVLAARGLMDQKGAPNTYDWPAIARFLADVAARRPTRVPEYAHATNDLSGRVQWVPAADVVILEGMIALQPALAQVEAESFFLTASERANHAWYVERCAQLHLHQLYGLTPKAFATLREQAWTETNLRNYRDYVLPLLPSAGHVLTLGVDHRIQAIDGQAVATAAIG